VKGDSSMNLFMKRLNLTFIVWATMTLLMLAVPSMAEDYKVFYSEEYGFTMKYPASWVKIDKPKGNYYVVFQSPDLSDNFRSRIHVAAHKPVKDPVSVFLQELRNGITDLQKKSGGGQKEQQEVRILDEGEFKCEVPGAYYFFIQAFENNIKAWMDIVIVFYKQDQTLLRISCLAPSSVMEKIQPIFNDVLVSVKFASEGVPPAPAARPAPTPGVPGPPSLQTQPLSPPTELGRPEGRSNLPVPGRESAPGVESREPSLQVSPPTLPPSAVQPPAQPPRSGPRGPLREPDKPATGIVN
jgi:hypothetical protein